MWMYPGPGCPDRPVSKELGNKEINIWIHKALAHGVDLNSRAGPAPLREGVDNTWMSPLGPIFGCLCQFWFLNAFMLLCRVSCVLTVPHGESPYPRTQRGEKQTAPTMNNCGHGDREDGHEVPPRWRQGHRGRTPPLSLDPQRRMKKRVKKSKKGK
jgi:hypothetical protein